LELGQCEAGIKERKIQDNRNLQGFLSGGITTEEEVKK